MSRKTLESTLAALVLGLSANSFSDSVWLYWSPPIERINGDPMTIDEVGGYEIRYKRSSENTFTHKLINDNNITQYFFGDLFNARKLTFEVAVFDTNRIYSDFVTATEKGGISFNDSELYLINGNSIDTVFWGSDSFDSMGGETFLINNSNGFTQRFKIDSSYCSNNYCSLSQIGSSIESSKLVSYDNEGNILNESDEIHPISKSNLNRFLNSLDQIQGFRCTYNDSSSSYHYIDADESDAFYKEYGFMSSKFFSSYLTSKGVEIGGCITLEVLKNE